ncbi:MAG: glycine zipper 2TM domain-containing protein [Pseudomonadota bacterium]|nr:glycine zipper 2TM domain-containing protein [Pseudomonadota bacterium]
MKMSFMAGALAGAVVVIAGSAVAGYHVYQTAHTAKVLSAQPLTRTVKIPRQECRDEEVTHTKPVKDQNRLIGTGIGALVGGVLGHQIGGGSGKTLATVAGAGAGGYAGNKIQQNAQQKDTYTTTEQRCRTVYDKKEEPAGFDVVYDLNGSQHHLHTDTDPGSSLPVKDGKVELASLKNAPSATNNSKVQ